MMSLEEHKKDLITVVNSGECYSLNTFIALLELKKTTSYK